jgi:hypothetical protein
MIMGEQPRSLSPTFPDLPLDGDFEDLLELAMADDSEESLRSRYSPQNAVHMEIQENAKLPTFNLTIDRSNSVPRQSLSQQPYSPTTRQEIEEMMRLSEKDFSLTEVFLKSNNRSNQNMNYGSSAGAMLGSVGDRIWETSSEAAAASSTRPPVTTGGGGSSSSVSGGVPNPLSTSGVNNHDANRASQPGRQPYYQRPYQLPIPRGREENVAPKPLNMAAAIATAAAIVSQVPSDEKAATVPITHRATPSPTQLLPTNPQQPIVSTQITSMRTVGGPVASTAMRTAVPPQSYHQYPPPRSAVARPAMPYSRLNAAAAAAPTPQILSATKQRSQFGFGGNHQVPCVPRPPKRALANSSKQKKKATSKVPVHSPVLLSSSMMPPGAGNAGPAYERKKQRAKDARVKLNDSIERLSIAMSMAGTQSHQRSLQPASSLMSGHCKASMEHCHNTAESAKKWDRPGFVGTAAALIQSLNAQCESLMREVIKHQQASGVANCNGAVNGMHTPNGHKRSKNGEISSEGSSEDDNYKRVKVIDTSEAANLVRGLVLDNDDAKILSKIASFLDPRSLLRCQCLTRRIQGVFGSDALWLDRCIQRFGHFHVRQWKEKLQDEENEENDEQHLSSIVLYREMDAENVKPIHTTTSTNHHVDLAEARMLHQVSAWVTMVERSNGETCRSVKHHEDGRYTSLPVVELRFLIQNTGSSSTPIVIRRDQMVTVDASTRRRGEEWKEITCDDRFDKQWLDVQDQPLTTDSSVGADADLVQLELYESVILLVHIHCKGCSTSSKFQQRANFTKILVQLNGTTVPLVIPFFRET